MPPKQGLIFLSGAAAGGGRTGHLSLFPRRTGLGKVAGMRPNGDRGRSPGELWVLSFAGKYLARGRNIPRPSPEVGTAGRAKGKLQAARRVGAPYARGILIPPTHPFRCIGGCAPYDPRAHDMRPYQIDPERQGTREAQCEKGETAWFDRHERQRAEDAAAPSSRPRRTNLGHGLNVRSGFGPAGPRIFGYFPSMESTSPGGEISPVFPRKKPQNHIPVLQSIGVDDKIS